MTAPPFLPPRRNDNKSVTRISTALLAAVEALAKKRNYTPADFLNQGAEMVLAHYGEPVPPIESEQQTEVVNR